MNAALIGSVLATIGAMLWRVADQAYPGEVNVAVLALDTVRDPDRGLVVAETAPLGREPVQLDRATDSVVGLRVSAAGRPQSMSTQAEQGSLRPN